MLLYYGVELKGIVGVYRTFWALLDAKDPRKILKLEDVNPILESSPALTEPLKDQLYVSDVVFTTGISDGGNYYIVASGEADLACRITHIPKTDLKLE